MGIRDLFKTSEEIRNEMRKKVRRAQRNVENAAASLQDKIREQKKSQNDAWNEARTHLKNGQTIQAKRSLQTVQLLEKLILQQEKKFWVFNQYAMKMEMALIDKDISSALGTLCNTIEISPDQIEDVLFNITDKLGDQELVEKIWNKEHRKSIDALNSDEDMQSIDDMMQTLSNEVAANINTLTPPPPRTVSVEKKSSIAEEIERGQKELQNLRKDVKK